jgi:hypothetical protein
MKEEARSQKPGVRSQESEADLANLQVRKGAVVGFNVQ